MTERFSYADRREALSAARASALEALLIEKGVITAKSVDTVLDVFATKMGPFNGAKMVARAWVDPAYRDRLVADTPSPKRAWRTFWPMAKPPRSRDLSGGETGVTAAAGRADDGVK